MALAEKFSKPTWTRYTVLLWLGGAATIAEDESGATPLLEKMQRDVQAYDNAVKDPNKHKQYHTSGHFSVKRGELFFCKCLKLENYFRHIF